MLTLSELNQFDNTELLKELNKAKLQLLKYKLGVKTGHLKEIHILKQYKTYIARIMTLISQQKNPNSAKKEITPAT